LVASTLSIGTQPMEGQLGSDPGAVDGYASMLSTGTQPVEEVLSSDRAVDHDSTLSTGTQPMEASGRVNQVSH